MHFASLFLLAFFGFGLVYSAEIKKVSGINGIYQISPLSDPTLVLTKTGRPNVGGPCCSNTDFVSPNRNVKAKTQKWVIKLARKDEQRSDQPYLELYQIHQEGEIGVNAKSDLSAIPAAFYSPERWLLIKSGDGSSYIMKTKPTAQVPSKCLTFSVIGQKATKDPCTPGNKKQLWLLKRP